MPVIFKTPFAEYTQLKSIGQGGSGTVYQAVDENQTFYAVKVLDPSSATTEKRKRFKNEILFCERSVHPNVITVVGYGMVTLKGKESPFYVMPFYPTTLREVMKKGIHPEDAIRFFTQILDGVEAAHLKSVWHRDLKPENILFDERNHKLVVADFGIAHFHEDLLQTSIETAPNAKLANFRYAAPEQRTPGTTVDRKADIYALGLILYEMFTGLLLQGTGHKKIAQSFSEFGYLDDIIDGMVRQSPDERFPTIDIIKQKLIANKLEFVSRQKINTLEQTVIPETDIVDPIIAEPIRLIGVDVQLSKDGYRNMSNGNMIFHLSQSANDKWINAFKSIGNFTYIAGECEPKLFEFSGRMKNEATLALRREPDQRYVDLFKSYLVIANRDYDTIIRNEQRQKIENEKRKLQDEIEREKMRQNFLQALKI